MLPYSSENVVADSWLQRRSRLPRGRNATARCPHLLEMFNVILLVQKRVLFLKGLQIALSCVLQNRRRWSSSTITLAMFNVRHARKKDSRFPFALLLARAGYELRHLGHVFL